MSKSDRDDREDARQWSEFQQEAAATGFVIFLFWLAVNALMTLAGMAEQGNCYREYAVKRIEVVLPGYRVGRWLLKPVHSCVEECNR